MSKVDTVQIVALIGWLSLCVSALSAQRLSLKKGLSIALIWLAIFVGMALLILVVR